MKKVVITFFVAVIFTACQVKKTSEGIPNILISSGDTSELRVIGNVKVSCPLKGTVDQYILYVTEVTQGKDTFLVTSTSIGGLYVTKK